MDGLVLKAPLVLAVGEAGDQGQRVSSCRLRHCVGPYQADKLYEQEHLCEVTVKSPTTRRARDSCHLPQLRSLLNRTLNFIN